jgi:arsenate reductase
MQEIDIDISGHRSKGFDEVPVRYADVVVTLCAEEECPVAATTGERLAWPLPDPAAATGADPLAEFRSVRDEIARRLEQFFAARETSR